MNRKLHNSLMAVVSSSALLVVGLLAAVPAQQSLAPPPTTVVVIAEAATDDDAGAMRDPADATTEAPRRHARSRGQSVQMPFFSFVPRG
ncbi:MAG TPA: hypothetical protein VLC71_07995 [Thermomonas sp.]|nr:hypothetical protein [Thermomonas sp.]